MQSDKVICTICQTWIKRRESIEVAPCVFCCPEHVKEWRARQIQQQKEETETQKEQEAKKRLEEYICERYGIEKPTPLMKRQMIRFKREDGMSYQGMYLTLYYCFSLSDPPAVPRLEAGIAIISYFYDVARQFYKQRKQIQQQTEVLDLAVMGKARVVNVHNTVSPSTRAKGRMIDIESIGGDDE